MNGKPLVSVIIPVYNSDKRLIRTVRSIVDQKIDRYEIILINDGSTKMSSNKLYTQIALANPSIRLINNLNQGIVQSRICGIKEALGKFIIFSDHDDIYLAGSFCKMLTVIQKEGCDIVVGRSTFKFLPFLPSREYHTVIQNNVSLNSTEFFKKEYLNFFGYNQFPVATWGKLYKTELIRNVDFEIYNYNFMDDIILNIQIFYHADKISFIEDFVYEQAYGGLTSVIDIDNVISGYVDIYQLKKKFLYKTDNQANMKFVFYELKNILYHCIHKFFESAQTDETSFERLMNKFKNSLAFEELVCFYAGQDDIINELESGNINYLYKYGSRNYQKDWIKITAKKVIKRIIT